MEERNLDTSLRLVADQRRRQTIHHLRQASSDTLTIDELVEQLRQGETDTETPDQRELASQLYHAHLPKLADQGIVEIDPETQVVRYQPDEQIETLLDSLPAELPRAAQ